MIVCPRFGLPDKSRQPIIGYIIYNERAKRSTFFFTFLYLWDISLFRYVFASHAQEALCHVMVLAVTG
jgi:hypothetical protein